MVCATAYEKEWLPEYKNNIFIQYDSVDGANFGKHGTANLDYDAEVIPYDEKIGENIEKLGFKDNKIFFAEKDELCEDEKNIRSYNNGLL